MRFPSTRCHCRGGRRAGLTIVEVLAALVVVSVGLLAMAGTSALTLRASTAAAAEARAVERVQRRLADLASAGCARAASGTADESRDGIREHWSVSAPAHGAAMVDASADWMDGARPRTTTLRTALLC